MSPYQYSPLKGRNVVRVLKIEPSPDKDAQLRASFHPVSLAESPEFEALSYVWGDANFNGSIKLDGDDLAIPSANLDAALRQFRYADRPRLIWADAVCINQNDIPERNSQVLIMAEIYRKAKTTLGWLGRGDEAEENALRKLVEVADSAPLFGQYARGLPPFKSQTPLGSRDDVADMKGDPSQALAMAAEAGLGLVFANSWFTRLWIVQEAILSSDLLLCLGKEEVEWSVFEAATTLVYRAFCRTGLRFPGIEVVEDAVGLILERQRQGMFRRPPGLDTNSSAGTRSLLGNNAGSTSGIHTQLIKQLDQLSQGQQVVIMSDRSQRFLDTIWGLRHRACADDRDRIYAARSFIPWDVPVHVHVNYARSVVDVYTAFTRELLNAGIAEVLLLAGLWDRKTLPSSGGNDDADEAPSWVCDLRLPKLRRGTDRPWSHPLDQTSDTSVADFETPEISWPDPAPTSRTVMLGAIVVDQIGTVSGPPPGIGSGYTTQVVSFCLCARLSIFRRARFPGEDSDAPPSWEQIAGLAEVLGVDGERCPGAVSMVAKLVVQGRQQMDAMLAPAGLSTGVAWELGPEFVGEISQEDHREVSLLVGRMSAGAAFFSTTSGNVGFGPAMLESRDTIVRVMGLLTPCIVRSFPGTEDCRLIGGCYLHDPPDLAAGDYGWLSLV
ncbi:heterokaryon incompatibility protein-domain-containing protein [Lasiosphaeria hispida]|uniref:Heterokaryon incompatibility protein-domain-containing protein n=1 Tax=Lasiosphaeria hispida TaxID=260671 RepID=A0AAJ0M9H6_9PEZI|nr:heterokaryon incompatibility protein-domain-containing protein [Lasiosphaeria hispida]